MKIKDDILKALVFNLFNDIRLFTGLSLKNFTDLLVFEEPLLSKNSNNLIFWNFCMGFLSLRPLGL